MTVFPLGDSAAVIVLGDSFDAAIGARVRAIATAMDRDRPVWVTDVVPAFVSVAVFFDPLQARDFEEIRRELEARVAGAPEAAAPVSPRTIEVPVVYGGEAGPDLAALAAHVGFSEAEVVARHAGADYWVNAIGFVPGFPYLRGLPPELAMPRRATPRPHVPAGSVGIGGPQTGVYPLGSPGGWNLIGRTPLVLFDPDRAEPALLRAGDRVKFRAVADADFGGVRPGASPAAAASATQSPAAIEIVRPGLFTTVQDLGRPGHRAHGVPLGGAADAFSSRVANLLVGNPEDAAVLEFTIVGPEIIFLRDMLIALGGGMGEGAPRWRPLVMRAGTTLNLGPLRSGCRGYLAVAGGFDVAPVLGSRSTDVRGGFGGFAGRALRAGDRLPVPEVHRDPGDHWQIDPRFVPEPVQPAVLRVVAGEHADQFAPQWTAHDFTVAPQSDRMGVRLEGAALRRHSGRELLSSPVAPGTVQVPPDGRPIILLADAQTIGGYPRIAHVISVDLPRAAQLRPGDAVRFATVSLDEAHRLAQARERGFVLLRAGLAQKVH